MAASWLFQRSKPQTLVLFAASLAFASAQAQQTPAAAAAQNFQATMTAAALKTLSPESQRTIGKLLDLTSLPAENWRYKEGDVAHGSSPGLDDSAWLPIKGRYHADTTSGYWLRRWIEIPRSLEGYDLTGARLFLQAWASDNATVYYNGQRVAEGEVLEPIVLTESAHPGDKILVAVHISSSTTMKNVSAAHIRVEPASGRPSPEDLYTEFVTATLLLPELAPNNTQARETLEKAIHNVDLSVLKAGQQKPFDDSLLAAQHDLAPLQPILQRAIFHVSGDSHIDSAWLWPWTETVDVVRRTFATALQLMNEYPDYTYTQSAAQYNQWIADKYPRINEGIQQKIKQGRWELVGGMWVEPDLNMSDGESEVRQLLIGQRLFKSLYGVTTRIGWNPDSFGYNWQLPQIYKKSGMDYFVTQKMATGDTNPLPFKLFWWQSPDGSKVLTYFPHGYGSRNIDPVRLAADLKSARVYSPGLSEMMDLYGVGDHGGGPTRTELDQGEHWTGAHNVIPKMQFGDAQSFFSDIENKVARNSPVWNYRSMAGGVAQLTAPPSDEISIPTWNDELYFEYHRGTYTTQAQHKRNMRESEEWLLNTEKYSSIAWLYGGVYPNEELTESWKKVLFNQFHDLAAGSGIAQIYRDAEKDYADVRLATMEDSAHALATVESHIDTRVPGFVPLLVVNPLGWQRSGLAEVKVQMPLSTTGLTVLDRKNRVVPSMILSTEDHTGIHHLLVDVKDVPSLGYTVLHVVPGSKPFVTDLRANGLTLENANLRVVVDANNGCITSLFDKKQNFETLAPKACANQLQTFEDKPEKDDAWNIDAPTLTHMMPITAADSVELVEKGPMRASIRIARHWQSSKFVQEIQLYAAGDEVNIVNDIDWHETHVLLKVAFPLAASGPTATYEIPYGTINRPTTRNNSWESAKFEVPALRWADAGDGQHGVSLLNESKYGYDCKDNVLRLTLLRSPTWPDPDADRGHQHFAFALYPHAGTWQQALSVRRGWEYNYTLHAMQVLPHSGALPADYSFVTADNPNVVLTAVKKAEDSDALLLRFYEWGGKKGTVTLHVPQGAQSATLANLMELPQGAALPVSAAGEVSVPVNPFEIVTVKVAYKTQETPR